MYSKRIVLHFPKSNWNKPIVYKLSKDFDLVFNILKASISHRDDASMMVLELTGPKEEFDKGIKYLNECGVKVEPIARSVRRIEEICIHCGACTAVCPTGALYIDRKTMEVIFDTEKCGGCELCVKACPPRAMEVSF